MSKSFTLLYTSIATYKNFELFIGLHKDLEKISNPFTTKDPQKSKTTAKFDIWGLQKVYQMSKSSTGEMVKSEGGCWLRYVFGLTFLNPGEVTT